MSLHHLHRHFLHHYPLRSSHANSIPSHGLILKFGGRSVQHCNLHNLSLGSREQVDKYKHLVHRKVMNGDLIVFDDLTLEFLSSLRKVDGDRLRFRLGGVDLEWSHRGMATSLGLSGDVS